METSYEGKDLEAMLFAENYHQWILDQFKPFLGNHVLEVGAGRGDFSVALLNSEKISGLVAIEPSKEMYPMLERRLKEDSRVIFHQAVFADMYRKYREYFDSVIYVNVLEHVENDAQELTYIRESLKEGGRVCIFVPTLPWLYSKFDASVGHYRRYTKKQLRQLLEQNGFKIEKISYFDIVGIVPWFIFIKLLGGKLGTSNVLLYDKIIVPLMRRIESVITAPLGKNLIAIGIKK
ncbi:MAG: methyltransferase domain-containing protein [Patescibacteria group bacterium]